MIAVFAVFFTFEAIYMMVPFIWIIYTFVFFVGFIGGCTVLSVFYRFTSETPPQYQVFAVCMVSIGLTIGVSSAAILAIPLHEMICKLPPPL